MLPLILHQLLLRFTTARGPPRSQPKPFGGVIVDRVHQDVRDRAVVEPVWGLEEEAVVGEEAKRDVAFHLANREAARALAQRLEGRPRRVETGQSGRRSKRSEKAHWLTS